MSEPTFVRDPKIEARIRSLRRFLFSSSFVEIHELVELSTYYAMGYDEALLPHEREWVTTAFENITGADKKKAIAARIAKAKETKAAKKAAAETKKANAALKKAATKAAKSTSKAPRKTASAKKTPAPKKTAPKRFSAG